MLQASNFGPCPLAEHRVPEDVLSQLSDCHVRCLSCAGAFLTLLCMPLFSVGGGGGGINVYFTSPGAAVPTQWGASLVRDALALAGSPGPLHQYALGPRVWTFQAGHPLLVRGG